DMRTAFIDGYRDSFGDMNEADKERKRALIVALELDKALYEAVYEARNRPDWIDIPVRAIEALITED
ncbi:1,4-alpha-glucan branching protein, partial [Actinomycetaceae bacterium UMB8039B]|nr:1,4-alpha-glucan branching protein [Actinomycetaceae bacterium UMB8039B]